MCLLLMIGRGCLTMGRTGLVFQITVNLLKDLHMYFIPQNSNKFATLWIRVFPRLQKGSRPSCCCEAPGFSFLLYIRIDYSRTTVSDPLCILQVCTLKFCVYFQQLKAKRMYFKVRQTICAISDSNLLLE